MPLLQLMWFLTFDSFLFSLCSLIFIICWICVFVSFHTTTRPPVSPVLLIWHVAAIPCPRSPHILLASCRPGGHISSALVLVGWDSVLTQVLVWLPLPLSFLLLPWHNRRCSGLRCSPGFFWLWCKTYKPSWACHDVRSAQVVGMLTRGTVWVSVLGTSLLL